MSFAKCAALLAVLSWGAYAKPTLRIGISAPDFCLGYHMSAIGYSVKLAWDRRYAPLLPRDPADFDVDISVVNDMCTPGANFNGALALLQASADTPKIHAFVGEMMTPVCENSGRLTTAFQVTHIASACVAASLRDRAAYPTFTTMMTPNLLVVTGCVNLLKELQRRSGELVRKASVFYTDESLGWSATNLLLQKLNEEGFERVVVKRIPLAFRPGIAPSEWAASLRMALAVNSHVNFIAVQASMSAQVLTAMAAANLTGPNRIWLDIVGGTVGAQNPNFDGSVVVTITPRGPQYTSAFEPFWTSLSPADFANESSGYYLGNIRGGPKNGEPKLPDSLFAPNIEPNRYAQEFVAHNTFDSVRLLVHLFDKHVKAANVGEDPEETFRSPTVIRQMMTENSMEGITGPVAFDSAVDRRGELVVLYRSGMGFRPFGTVEIDSTEIKFIGDWIFGNNSKSPPPLNPAPCAPGHFIDQETGACTECPIGQVSGLFDSAQCFDCIAGRYAPITGMSECMFCESGRFTESSGSTACEPCQPGTYSDAGAVYCNRCHAGFAAPQPAASACTPCTLGRFTADAAATACTACPGSRVTRYPGTDALDGCVCPAGTYAPSSSSSACESCPPGMDCPLGSISPYFANASDTTPRARPGFMTLSTAPLQAYRCVELESCPGGPPGLCDAGRDPAAIACGRCLPGHFRGDGGKCESCDGMTALPLVLTILGLLVVLLLLVLSMKRDFITESHGSHNVLVMGALMAFTMQSFGTLGQLSLNWLEPVRSLTTVFSVVMFDPSLLKMECVLNIDPVHMYTISMVVPFACLFVVVLLTFLRKLGPGSKVDVVLVVSNSLGTVCQAILISVLFSSFRPLVCYEHPGGRESSVRAHSSVLCFAGSEHGVMLGMGLASFLLLPAPFMALTVAATVWHPRMIKQGSGLRFLARTRFLFSKFRPPVYYYSCILAVRSLCLCLVPVLFRNKPSVQLFLVLAILSLALCVQQSLRPWRSSGANTVDSALTLLILLLVISSASQDLTDESHDMGIISTVIVAMLVTMLLLGAASALFMRFRRQKLFACFLCHHKADAGGQARYLKMLLDQTCSRPAFLDSDHLKDLDALFDVVKFNTDRLVVYLTRQTLSRPWCACEIVSARACKVPVVALRTPSFVDHSEEQLRDVGTFVEFAGFNPSVYGISAEAISEALLWFCGSAVEKTVLDAKLPLSQRLETISFLPSNVRSVMSVFSGTRGKQSSQLAETTASKGEVAIISFDVADDEATAAALILKENIGPQAFVAAGVTLVMVTEPIGTEENFVNVRALLVVLSAGTLQSLLQLQTIVQGVRARLSSELPLVPISAPGFRFVSEESLSTVLPPLVAADNVKRGQVAKLFKLIACPLSTNGSSATLKLECDCIASRIPSRPREVRSNKITAEAPSQSEQTNVDLDEEDSQGQCVTAI